MFPFCAITTTAIVNFTTAHAHELTASPAFAGRGPHRVDRRHACVAFLEQEAHAVEATGAHSKEKRSLFVL